VFANTRSVPNDAFDLYTTFKLSASGEYLGLYDDSGTLLTGFQPDGSDYPPQETDVSYGFAFEAPDSGQSITLLGNGAGEGNGSFEDLTGGNPNLGGNRIGGNSDATIPGWTADREAGFIGWDDDFSAADGFEYAFVNANSHAIYTSDPVPVDLQAGESLELSFESRNNVVGLSVTFRVSLLFANGSEVNFQEYVFTDDTGQFTTQSFSHVVNASQQGNNSVAWIIRMVRTTSPGLTMSS